jgi:hypothetical protein
MLSHVPNLVLILTRLGRNLKIAEFFQHDLNRLPSTCCGEFQPDPRLQDDPRLYSNSIHTLGQLWNPLSARKPINEPFAMDKHGANKGPSFPPGAAMSGDNKPPINFSDTVLFMLFISFLLNPRKFLFPGAPKPPKKGTPLPAGLRKYRRWLWQQTTKMLDPHPETDDPVETGFDDGPPPRPATGFGDIGPEPSPQGNNPAPNLGDIFGAGPSPLRNYPNLGPNNPLAPVQLTMGHMSNAYEKWKATHEAKIRAEKEQSKNGGNAVSPGGQKPVPSAESDKTPSGSTESGKTGDPKGEAKRQAEKEKAEREKAEREKAEREKAEREKAEREKAKKEKAEKEKAESEKAKKEKAEREKAEKEKAEGEKSKREKAERDKAKRAKELEAQKKHMEEEAARVKAAAEAAAAKKKAEADKEAAATAAAESKSTEPVVNVAAVEITDPKKLEAAARRAARQARMAQKQKAAEEEVARKSQAAKDKATMQAGAQDAMLATALHKLEEAKAEQEKQPVTNSTPLKTPTPFKTPVKKNRIEPNERGYNETGPTVNYLFSPNPSHEH